jgi:hypothetical protein
MINNMRPTISKRLKKLKSNLTNLPSKRQDMNKKYQFCSNKVVVKKIA